MLTPQARLLQTVQKSAEFELSDCFCAKARFGDFPQAPHKLNYLIFASEGACHEEAGLHFSSVGHFIGFRTSRARSIRAVPSKSGLCRNANGASVRSTCGSRLLCRLP